MSYQVEQHVIGGLLLDNGPLMDLELVPDDFSVEIHEAAFRTITELVSAGETADVVTVAERLERLKQWKHNPLAYLGELANNTISTRGIKSHAALVRHSAQSRRALGILMDGVDAVKEQGIEAADEVIGRLMQLHNGRGVRERLLQDAVVDAINRLEAIQKHGESKGLSTGLLDLDSKLGGLQPGELYVIGARPSMGKTAMALCSAIRAGVPVGFFSGEQPEAPIGNHRTTISKPCIPSLLTGIAFLPVRDSGRCSSPPTTV